MQEQGGGQGLWSESVGEVIEAERRSHSFKPGDTTRKLFSFSVSGCYRQVLGQFKGPVGGPGCVPASRLGQSSSA